MTLQHVASILRCVVAIGKSFSRLGILSKVPPFPYLICLLKQERIQELDIPFVVRPFKWFFHLLEHGSFHFVPCIFPLLWVLWFICDWQGFIN